MVLLTSAGRSAISWSCMFCSVLTAVLSRKQKQELATENVTIWKYIYMGRFAPNPLHLLLPGCFLAGARDTVSPGWGGSEGCAGPWLPLSQATVSSAQSPSRGWCFSPNTWREKVRDCSLFLMFSRQEVYLDKHSSEPFRVFFPLVPNLIFPYITISQISSFSSSNVFFSFILSESERETAKTSPGSLQGVQAGSQGCLPKGREMCRADFSKPPAQSRDAALLFWFCTGHTRWKTNAPIPCGW